MGEAAGLGRVVEMLSRVLAGIDRLERGLEGIRESLDALALTVYLPCLEERLGGFREVRRHGLPEGVSFIAVAESGRVFVGRARAVCTGEDALWLASRGLHAAGLLGYGGEVEGVLVCSEYRGGPPPRGVRVVLC